MSYGWSLDSDEWDGYALYDIRWGVEAYNKYGTLIGSTFENNVWDSAVFDLKLLNSSCGTGGTGTPYPESGHVYGDNKDYTWEYNYGGDPGAINVTFSSCTFVENNYDFIYIMNEFGNEIQGSPFTGNELAGQTVRVSGNTLKIRMTTDSSGNYWGFAVTDIEEASSDDYSGSGGGNYMTP